MILAASLALNAASQPSIWALISASLFDFDLGANANIAPAHTSAITATATNQRTNLAISLPLLDSFGLPRLLSPRRSKLKQGTAEADSGQHFSPCRWGWRP